ncbi:intradiol ring-cleavage dioxygenase [Aspergillus homomorphus CBS 101889]|uniref:Aromatic compound dioxygenase n=1 Tax=Aspergillus homomorphus (strain CBS 101889) TaxID=1450537 RepID=A0A395HYN7_ASPHC|nr:aromatic compound dioxygenase [Aspergillus homomorphus CBS 101889]RAL12646.1 aromatic compound dioxygenase [Aspergillus homomorphus CBS 101889]
MHLQTLLHLSLLGTALLATAHPGHHDEHEALQLRSFKRSLAARLQKCAPSLEASGVRARAEARRRAQVEQHRRQVRVRDTASALNASHEATRPISPFSPASYVFNDDKNICLLGPSPEGETGPYWLPGETIRSRIREDQPGIPVVIEQQYIDAATCQPIPRLWTEIWGCNATGVYSGLVAEGNGNAADLANRQRSFLRGVQQTDREGVVTFETLFPGHYASRATHYHNIVHVNATLLPNNTLAGGAVPHIGQIFWDQKLIEAVEATYPYNTNAIPITPNAEDRVIGVETQGSGADPFLQFAYLGDKIEDGLFAWITVAVDLSAVHYPYFTNVWTAEGGQAVQGTSDGDPRAIDGGLPSTTSAA